jgi:glycosyltransferase involved in cell wall biosynthesis
MTPIPGSVDLQDIPFKKRNVNDNKASSACSKDIVYLGTLIRERRLDFLIRVLSEVVKNEPTAKLILIGSGENLEDEQLLQHEVKRYQLEHAATFTGYLPMSKAWEYIRQAWVCVSPYYPIPILQSTSPTKLIEYMAMGKAVVGNDHPEQSLVITESGGGLCTPWDEEKFAEAIIQLLKNPNMAEEMGRKGRAYVEKFRTNEKMTNIVVNEYKRLLVK